MRSLEEIPTTAAPPPAARPSAVVAALRALRPSRRTVLRGLLVSAAAATLVPLDWYLTRREAGAAPDDDSKSEYMSCQPASYDEKANNWPAEGPAVCYGGWRRGGFPCEDGFHREGFYEGFGEKYESTRLATNCEGKNAWRWNGWRCSDGLTNITFPDGEVYHGITIAACQISADDRGAATERVPAATPTPTPTPAPEPTRRPRSRHRDAPPPSAPAPEPAPAPAPEPTPEPTRAPRRGLLG